MFQVNPWSLVTLLRSKDSDISDILSDHKNVLIIFEPDWFSNWGYLPDMELFKALFGNASYDLKQVCLDLLSL